MIKTWRKRKDKIWLRKNENRKKKIDTKLVGMGEPKTNP